ncbi:hypothetical protein OROGR_016590 [Orobanche gracilis]
MVGILKRVLEEVEKVMQEFKGMLYKAMEDPNIDPTNLENTVRLMLELEPESDPIKHYLNIQNHKIRGLLEKCTLDHEARIENLQNELREKALSDAKWRQIQSSAGDYSPSDVNSDLAGDLFLGKIYSEELDAFRGRYIGQLTAVLVHHVPLFWKVALSVSSGKFAKSSQGPSDPSTNSSLNKTEDKVGDLAEVSGMIHNTLTAYESKVLAKMLNSLQSELAKSEDVSAQLQEMQESVRLAFLNCLLDFAGHLEHIGFELTQNRSNIGSPHFQNGYVHELVEKSLDPLPGSIADPHQQLLMVLSNIGYCKDELAYELYGNYKCIWQQSREKVEDDGDMQELVMSFSLLEEKVIAQYTVAKTSLIRSAAVSYLLDAGVQWGATPAVKGVRDAAVDLLHTLVAVHTEVFAGCKPLLDKILGILVEGLIDILLGLFNENKMKDLRALDANGFSQLMLELEYYETILNPYFTHDARESLKSLQGVLLEKAIETVTEAVETPSHQRRPTRGSDDVLADDRLSTASPDDLIALAQQYSSELLQGELERTRINTACFVETLPLDSVPESAKAAYASLRGSMDSPSRRSYGGHSPSFSRHRRR